MIDLRVGRWQEALADVQEVSAVICDPPYGARTHKGNDGMHERFRYVVGVWQSSGQSVQEVTNDANDRGRGQASISLLDCCGPPQRCMDLPSASRYQRGSVGQGLHGAERVARWYRPSVGGAVMGKPMDCKALREAVETWPELDRLRRLREALRHWQVGPHAQWCVTRAECPCDCGASEEFEARTLAWRLIGIEEEP